MKTINIRFLKAGSVTAEVAEGLTKEMLARLAQTALDEMTDKQLIDSMKDHPYDSITQSVFDEDSFSVEAIEDINNEYKLLYQTKAWKDYQAGDLSDINNSKSIDLSNNNGGKTDYYDLPKDVKDIQDIIETKGMGWNIANIFKACYRMGSQDHSSTERDLNKIIYFAKRQLALEKASKEGTFA